MKRSAILAILLVAGRAPTAWTATPGTVATDPFDLGMSAAVSAMGGAASAAPGGLWSLAYNPAGLADVRERTEAKVYEFQVAATYVQWLESSSIAYGAVALPPGFAVGAVGFDQGTITTSDGFLSGGTEKISDFGAIAGYGAHLPWPASNVSLGISVQYWQKNLAGLKASTFAVNAGGQVSLIGDQLTLGAYVQNLGPALKFETTEKDEQPLAYSGGIGLMLPKLGSLPLRIRLLADVIRPSDQGTVLGGGGELTIQDVLALRAGVNTAGEFTQPSYGAGLLYRGFGFDYSFSNVHVDYEDIATHRVSIRYALGGGI